jgi:PleD family two-component response regulator
MAEFPLKTKNGQVTVSISTGTALRAPGRHMTGESLIELADQALYRAKQASRTGTRSSITAA